MPLSDGTRSTVTLDATVAANARVVRERISRAANRSGRDPASVRLVAVTKTFPMTHVRAAVAAGLYDLGENRVQEALSKMPQAADLAITWHLIGHLQSNKARRAAEAFAWIHVIDSMDLLSRVERAARDAGTHPSVLVQVDLAGEATKFGAATDDVPAILHAAVDCTAVSMKGLMVVPPWADDPETVRPFFRRLRQLRDELGDAGIPAPMLEELSMGMSHDLDVAVEEGATMVRVGTALFGPRPSPEARV